MDEGGATGMLTRRSVLLASGVGVLAIAAGPALFRSGLLPGTVATPSDQTLSAPEALERMRAGNLALVDIRRPDEWAETGSPDGAIRLDMRRPDFAKALQQALEGDESPQVALICAAGVRSARLARQLTEAGFTDILDVSEGMLGSKAGPGWIARGLPLSKG